MLTNLCLAYIMMEVGLEFDLDKTRLKSYGLDFFFAFSAAALPWILCSVYFMSVLQTNWQASFLIGVFAAPTSAGILFAMLAAAGLGTSWIFRKAQVLAVFDDFVAILLLIPFQIIFIGFKPGLIFAVFFMVLFLVIAFRWLHALNIPTGKYWLLLYGMAIIGVQHLVYETTKMDVGVLLPAFAFGAILHNPHLHKKNDLSYDKIHQEPVKVRFLMMDRLIKGFFMFLVGCSLPKIQLQDVGILFFVGHVVALTLLSNLGKCFLFFCYRQEASWKNRLALSIAMFPRGEVGA
ncbi:MAG: cation:proton antiporter, partial [Candidatus Omnitrophica bacterium]|nr:cation:proton antiporter [Candidatus Omnitrophota bacterium]